MSSGTNRTWFEDLTPALKDYHYTLQQSLFDESKNNGDFERRKVDFWQKDAWSRATSQMLEEIKNKPNLSSALERAWTKKQKELYPEVKKKNVEPNIKKEKRRNDCRN